MGVQTFNCGHPRSPENSKGSKWPACRTCAQMRDRERPSRKGRVRGRARADHNTRDYSAVADMSPVLGRDDTPQIEQATRSLLNALYREHPYVFDAAERAGRLAVRP